MKLRVLVLGRNAQIMETVLRLINSQENWQAVGALTDEDALKLFTSQTIDLVLVGGGVEEPSERELTAAFRKTNPCIKIIRHYGGGSGLLFNEIIEAMGISPKL